MVDTPRAPMAGDRSNYPASSTFSQSMSLTSHIHLGCHRESCLTRGGNLYWQRAQTAQPDDVLGGKIGPGCRGGASGLRCASASSSSESGLSE